MSWSLIGRLMIRSTYRGDTVDDASLMMYLVVGCLFSFFLFSFFSFYLFLLFFPSFKEYHNIAHTSPADHH